MRTTALACGNASVNGRCSPCCNILHVAIRSTARLLGPGKGRWRRWSYIDVCARAPTTTAVPARVLLDADDPLAVHSDLERAPPRCAVLARGWAKARATRAPLAIGFGLGSSCRRSRARRLDSRPVIDDAAIRPGESEEGDPVQTGLAQPEPGYSMCNEPSRCKTRSMQFPVKPANSRKAGERPEVKVRRERRSEHGSDHRHQRSVRCRAERNHDELDNERVSLARKANEAFPNAVGADGRDGQVCRCARP